MQRYEETKIISNAKKIDTNGNETTVRRLSTTIYPDFLRNGTGTRIISQDGDRLDNLAKEFKLNIRKTIFPYNFYTEENKNYIGSKPDLEYFTKSNIKSKVQKCNKY